jgi:hypothetical protein
MTRIAHLLAAAGFLLAGERAWGAADGDSVSEAGLGYGNGMHNQPAEASLRTGGAYSGYMGSIAESDLYGGFADVDGDGRKDLLIVVDNDLTCDDNVCDFFVFAPVVKDRQVVTACDWHLVENRRRAITREAGRRLVDVDGHSVALLGLPQKMPCTLDGDDWLTYFHFIYRYTQNDGSHVSRYAALTDIRPGNASAEGDMIE